MWLNARNDNWDKDLSPALAVSNFTYLLEFILAENGFDEMFSSIGRFTDGIGTLEMPLS